MKRTAVIGGRGTTYPYPDISAVDQHVGQLYKRIEGTACWLPELFQNLWAHIDMRPAVEEQVAGAEQVS